MIGELLNGHALNEEEAESLFARLMRGDLSEIEMTALLVALKMQGEPPAAIAGAARAMRAASIPFDAGMAVADSCGTGGDGCHTLNISTAVALVAAECGVPMAKHGNRSVSSQCGSADVLEALGVEVDAPIEVSLRSLRETGVCFLFAPQYHAGLRHAMAVRRSLGVRTILNLLGPLANPAAPMWQVVGVYDARYCLPMAETLGRLGCAAALVVHGGGLDEIALHEATQAAMLRHGSVRPMEISPADAGLESYPLDRLRGGDAQHNADLLRTILQGNGPPAHRAAVALNTAALLLVADRAENLREGARMALDILTSDRAWRRLQHWIEVQHGAR